VLRRFKRLIFLRRKLRELHNSETIYVAALDIIVKVVLK
jgi:hypothetical protein